MDLGLSLDFSTTKTNEIDDQLIYDHLIIGGGPAGMNAALYAKRKGLEVVILAKGLGGQIVNTSLVDNYLGFSESEAEDMVEAFKKHLKALEVPIKEGVEVLSIKKEEDIFYVLTDMDKTYKARTLLFATGAKSRKLGVKGEERLAGRGVAYCAICDAPFYKDRDVIIAGGGNSAVEAAIDLSKIAKSVTIVHRSQFRADQILVDQLYNNSKIKVHLETQIIEILGDQFVTGVKVLDKKKQEESMIEGDGVFIEIGTVPNSQLLENMVLINDRGEIIVDEKKNTSIKGIYAAGDVTNSPYNQIITATSDGAVAALSASEYLNTLGTVNKDEQVA